MTSGPAHAGGDEVPPLVRSLRAYHRDELASFHMPGHKQRGGMHPLTEEVLGTAVLRADVSEMGGFDYLHAPEGPLVESQARAARLFGADRTFFLVNGSTVGNLAALQACSAEGQRVVMLRGSHRSVYAGLVLSGAEPVYVPMAHDREEDGWFLGDVSGLETIDGPVSVVHVTRPNYYGMACDLAPFRALADRTGAVLVVDEAHGSHLGLHPSLPRSALQEGADVVIQSTHKTLGALTQASMLHVRGDRVDVGRLARTLQVLQSSSPSALLSLSLDLAVSHLASEGRSLLGVTIALADDAARRIDGITGLRVVRAPSTARHDPTKVVVDVTGTGRTGFAAAEWLRREARVWIELADFRRIVCSITLADDHASVALLVDALQRLASTRGTGVPTQVPELGGPPPIDVAPRRADQSPTRVVPLGAAAGLVSAEYLIPYPPGIPLVVPGERLSAEALDALRAFVACGSRVVGPLDPSLDTVRVLDR